MDLRVQGHRVRTVAANSLSRSLLRTSFQRRTETGTFQIEMLTNGNLSSLFQAVIEATEESIINSMTMATTTTGRSGPNDACDPVGGAPGGDESTRTLSRASKFRARCE